jgi:hypothetical protein
MTTVGMEVRGFDIEADEPAVTLPSNRCEKDPGARAQSWPLYRGLRLLDRAKKSPQPPGVVVHPDLADDRQYNCSRMPFGDPDVAPSAPADPVAQAEAVTAAALPFRRWEADSVSLEANALRLRIGGQSAPKVDGCLFEHLRRDFASPPKPN